MFIIKIFPKEKAMLSLARNILVNLYLLMKQSIHLPTEQVTSWIGPIDIWPIAIRPRFLVRIHGNVPWRVPYPSPTLIIDLGTSLAPAADHPNGRERTGVSRHCEVDLYYRTSRQEHTDSKLIRVIDKQCHAPVAQTRWKRPLVWTFRYIVHTS